MNLTNAADDDDGGGDDDDHADADDDGGDDDDDYYYYYYYFVDINNYNNIKLFSNDNYIYDGGDDNDTSPLHHIRMTNDKACN